MFIAHGCALCPLHLPSLPLCKKNFFLLHSKNIHFFSLKNPLHPFFLLFYPFPFEWTNIRIFSPFFKQKCSPPTIRQFLDGHRLTAV
uniref:Uncharacterized protein n=1 Tax=Meloidogyne enterolobii TaxID=390850 RepID=A0A6V7WJ89_MELEN|nr:unnamed protein product [Meloidogyne enterolobii]